MRPCASFGVPALVHSAGCRPPARESYSLHFIFEETIAVTSLLSSTVTQDFPELNLIISHAGGAVLYQVGRYMAQVARDPSGRTYIDRLRTLWFDTCLYTKDAIELLLETVSSSKYLFGSEKPGTGSVRNPANGRWFDDIRLLIDEIDWLTDERIGPRSTSRTPDHYSSSRPPRRSRTAIIARGDQHVAEGIGAEPERSLG